MKIKITFKCPDAVDYAVAGVLDDEDNPGLDEDEIKDRLSKWVKYNELVTIEFDIVNNTAKVCEVSKR